LAIKHARFLQALIEEFGVLPEGKFRLTWSLKQAPVRTIVCPPPGNPGGVNGQGGIISWEINKSPTLARIVDTAPQNSSR
jgi:hypothetical protein